MLLSRDQFIMAAGGVWAVHRLIATCGALTPAQARLLIVLLSIDGRHGKKPGCRTLGRLCGVPHQNATRGLNKLKKMGLIGDLLARDSRKLWGWLSPEFWADSEEKIKENLTKKQPSSAHHSDGRKVFTNTSNAHHGGGRKSANEKIGAHRGDGRCAHHGGGRNKVYGNKPPSFPPCGADVDRSGQESERVRPKEALGDTELLEAQKRATARAMPNGSAYAAAKAVAREAQAKAEAHRMAGDTELVHGLCERLGDADRGQWCRLDSLLFRRAKGNRKILTEQLLWWADAACGDDPGNAADAFKRKICNRFPKVGSEWMRKASV